MSRAAIGLVSRLLLRPRSNALKGACSSSSSIRAGACPGGWRSVGSNAVASMGSSSGSIISEHTAKWMTKLDKKSPLELIAEVPPIEVGARVVACEGGRDPSLGHPVEYISLDLSEPNTCKYCGLRYVQAHQHHH